MCGLLACGCGGATTGNGLDASGGADDRAEVTADSSSDKTPEDAAIDAGADAYSGPCTISTSSYDQSCHVDTDCASVTTGNYCGTGCLCGVGTINAVALAQFKAAVAKTPVGSGAVRGGDCPCAVMAGPCCRQGQCSTDCLSSSDTLPACADADGFCVLTPTNGCSRLGPANSCAYPDEICCLQ